MVLNYVTNSKFNDKPKLIERHLDKTLSRKTSLTNYLSLVSQSWIPQNQGYTVKDRLYFSVKYPLSKGGDNDINTRLVKRISKYFYIFTYLRC